LIQEENSVEERHVRGGKPEEAKEHLVIEEE